MKLPWVRLCIAVMVIVLMAPNSLTAQSPSVKASNDPNVEKLLIRLRANQGLSANFREKKHIALLSEPLISKGVIYYLPQGNLVRHTESPEQSTIRIRDTWIEMFDASGSSQISLDSQPTIKELVFGFLHLLSGDATALKRNYTLSLLHHKSSNTWTLTMYPRTAALRKLLKQISIKGHGIILTELVVSETTGDTATTQFSKVQINRKFSLAERRRIFGM